MPGDLRPTVGDVMRPVLFVGGPANGRFAREPHCNRFVWPVMDEREVYVAEYRRQGAIFRMSRIYAREDAGTWWWKQTQSALDYIFRDM